MTEHAYITPDNQGEPSVPDVALAAEAEDSGAQPDPANGAGRLMIPVVPLTAHPGNVRSDLDLTPEFCASVAGAGVRVSLLITKSTDGGYQVIEGHRRLAAALKAGLAEVPCELDPGRAGDEAGQYLDMLLANGDGYRRNFTPIEEAAALFAAHEAGRWPRGSTVPGRLSACRAHRQLDLDRAHPKPSRSIMGLGNGTMPRAPRPGVGEHCWPGWR
ncbi:MAG TPA: ParB N-terminal domain-containing protein [Streptosporangiaceae bacterium]